MVNRVDGQGGPIIGMLYWLIFAVAFAALGFAQQEMAYVWMAVPALAAAVMLFLLRERPRSFSITADGLEMTQPEETIPFSDIQSVVALKRYDAAQFSIAILNDRGYRVTNSRLAPSARKVLAAICSHLDEGGHRNVPESLEEMRLELVHKFGPDKVFCYRGRPVPTPGARKPRFWFFASMLAISFLFIICGSALPKGHRETASKVMIGAGSLMFPVGLIGNLICVSRHRWGSKAHPRYGLIISPIGLALVQGQVVGELEWDELVKVVFPIKPSSFQMQRIPIPGIGLRVEGSVIGIGDFYDRPLSMIHRRILEFWKGPTDDQE